MVEAARQGAVDYTAFELDDPNSWRRLSLILANLVASLYREELRARRDFDLIVYSVNPSDSDVRQRIEQSQAEYEASIRPYLRAHRGHVSADVARRLREAWQETFGRLDDPETQKRIERTVEHLKEMRRRRQEERRQMQEAREKLLRQRRNRRRR